jgi:AcrR family transcriptional regulator
MNSSSEERIQPLRARLRQATARDILASAEVVLADKGAAASMAAIARHARVAVGTIYNHFKDRDALLRALVLARRRDIVEQIAASAEATRGAPFRAQLGGFVAGMMDLFDRHRAFVRLALQGDGLLPRNVGKGGGQGTALAHWLARAVELVALGQQEGVLGAGDVEFQAHSLTGLMKGALGYGLARGEFAALAPAVVEQFLRGAAAPGKGRGG